MTPPESNSPARLRTVAASASTTSTCPIEMQGSFLEYAYSVIYSRALPDARDGLKPVQRRILYQMSEMGLRPDRGHVKSARVVGDVMGRLHPHGDTAIYDALVRLSQDFTMRVPLVDGHGNFGSLDDGPAAARYTEARMRAAAARDDRLTRRGRRRLRAQLRQPAHPAVGASGGLPEPARQRRERASRSAWRPTWRRTTSSRSRPPRRHLLENPEATLDDLMAYVPGPDLPTGGTIVGLDGIRDAYATGRGSFKTRAKVTVEQLSARRSGLVVTELPYLVGPEKVIEKIKDGVNSKKITGIADVTDLTDRKRGLRLVIGIKTGFSPEAVLEQLYRLTPLEDGFSINNVALVDGRPLTLGLRELLRVYLDHRIEVVTRRSQLPPAAPPGAPAPRRGTAGRDPRHRRGHPADPHERRRGAGSHPPHRRLRPQRCCRPTTSSNSSCAASPSSAGSSSRRSATSSAPRSPNSRRCSATRRGCASRSASSWTTWPSVSAPRAARCSPRRRASIATTAAARKAAAASGPSLEIADVPTLVVLSTTGRAVRIDLPEGTEPPRRREPPQQARRHPLDRRRHDARRAGRDHLSRTPGAVHARRPALGAAATRCSSRPVRGSRDYLGLADKKERVLGLVSLESELPIALGTRQGVVKRIAPGA